MGKGREFNQSIYNDILERIEEKQKNLSIKEFVKTVIEAHYSLLYKIKRIENVRLHNKRVFQKIDQNIMFLQEMEAENTGFYQEKQRQNYFTVKILNGENFQCLPENASAHYNIAYLSLRYCDIFHETPPQPANSASWNQKFRM